MPYFWDTGVFIGYCFYHDEDELPDGMSSDEIDSHSESSNKFVKQTRDDKHILAKHSKNEIEKKFRRYDKRIRRLIYDVGGGKRIMHPDFMLKPEDWKWIDDKKSLYDDYDEDELTSLFTDLFAKLETRKDYLLRELDVHGDYDYGKQRQLLNDLDEGDSRILATAINYNENVETILFVTTDGKDFRKINPDEYPFNLPKLSLLKDVCN